jgi:type IV secretory pathway VirJ component
VPGSEFIVLPGVGHDYSQRDEWLQQFRAAIARLSAQQPAPPLTVPKNLGDLPIVEVAASGAGETLAVLLSGDGGWAGLDKDVASALSDKGIPVVGVDSLRYFWTTRTPAGASSDIDRIVRYYLAHWNKRNVILIGYSQGADVLPFIVNRLPVATKRKVLLTALMGLGTQATFEFHLGNWISNGDDGLPIRPEIEKFADLQALCLYGDEEDDSLCPQVHQPAFHVEKLGGGHHFGGDYDQLAQLIIKYARVP